jgi:hypothetical protein
MDKVESPLSLGEKRVRAEFNPSGEGNVNCIKNDTAKLINVCEDMKPKEGEVVNGEKMRLIALAQTTYEEAAMWAVKAATA